MYKYICICILGIRRANGVCASDQRQRVRVTERSGSGGDVGMRPVEFHSRRRERRSSSHRAVLPYASRVTGCHAQESLSPRFRLSGRVIVRVTSRAAGRDEYMRPRPYPYNVAGCTRLFRCFSPLIVREDGREGEREKEREQGESIVPTARTLSTTN